MKYIVFFALALLICGCDWIQPKKKSEEPKKEKMGIELKLEPK